ncbi:hypothetical protein SFRURICE_017947, partial [Spodoptera frugiperda]
EDSSYPACELNAQGPAARGWRSEGTPPHELLLRLARVTSVHKLQLLAHHQLIPSKSWYPEGWCRKELLLHVELHTPASGKSHSPDLLSKPGLGNLARFVKLKLSGPHPPAKEDDQVALMAVNVLGEEVEDTETPPAQPVNKEPAYSPYDDLAFIMYVDNDIADLVRMLDEKKKVAVSEERFEYARRLKSAGAALASAGIRIGRWRLRKRTAAARDDFELARRMRDRIADALCGVKEDPQLCRLFEEDGPDRRNDSSMPQEYDFSHHLSPSVAAGSLSMDIPSPVPPIEQEREENEIQEPEYVNGEEEEEEDVQDMQPSPEPTLQEEVPPSYPEPVQQPVQMMPEENKEVQKIEEEELRKETDSPRRSITPNAANGSVVRRRNKSAGPRSTFEAYEERLLPALRHSHTNEYLREAREEECSGGSAATSHSRTAPPHKLNDRERKHAALPILIFGYPLVEKFYSKNYLDKEEGLSRLRAELSSPSNGSTKTSPNKTARAAAILLQRALRDKVFSVYSQANEKLLPELLRACGDPAPRVHSTAQHTVLTVADCPQVRSLHLIPQQLKMLNQAPTEEQLLNGNDQSMADSTLETASVTQSTRSGTTVSGMTASLGMTSSIGATSSYSLKSMTSSASGATLAPSSISGSYTTSRTKSSLKKSPTKRYTPRSTAKDFSNYPGYNKLRLDSAVSPKHSPRSNASGSGVEKVHFQESHSQSQSLSEQVVYRRTNRNSENRHSMIHYDHEPSKPQLKERPVTVYEPLHLDYRDSPTLGSPKTSKNDLRSMDSLPMDSPQMSRNDLRCDSDCRSLDSPKVKADYFRDGVLESPKLVAGLRNLHLDEHSQMDESGRRHQAASSEHHQYEPYDVGNADVSENIPENISLHTTCSWCGRRVRAEALEAHYWRRCVLLARCPHCRVALEARMLHAHLLEECTMSEGSWKACHKCGAALRTDDSDYHANCIPLGMDEWKCPYCFTNVLARDLPWQRHLMQCPRNPRTTQSS